MRGALILAGIGALLVAVVAGTWAGVRWATAAAERRGGAAGPLDAATVVERLGWKVPLDLHFTDSEGRRDRLGAFMGILGEGGAEGGGETMGQAMDETIGQTIGQPPGQPILLVLAYFNCRTLCNLVLRGTERSLAALEERAGRDYRVLTVSIDPRDTPLDAREKRTEIGAPEWIFLVGSEGEIRELAEAVGFGYHYDAATDQYSHPAVVFTLTPGGGISSYIYGIEPEPAEVREALSEAAAGGTRSTLQRILLRCYHYIPALRRYAGMVRWLLRACGVLTLVGFGVLFWRLIGRTPRRGMAS